jgi:hypothetical protein
MGTRGVAIYCYIEPELKLHFKLACAKKGVKEGFMLNQLIEKFVSENFVPERKFVKKGE